MNARGAAGVAVSVGSSSPWSSARDAHEKAPFPSTLLGRSMRRLIAAGATFVLVPAVSGCAYFTNYTRAVDLEGTSYAMDVKQRVVVSKKRQAIGTSGTATVVCAEPSPDALTVISASGGLSLNSAKTDITGNLSGALSESGAFVGLRTHSIQLLRDAMYRLCEGYAGGAINELTFQSLQRRYQSTMMGLIAIEQLTGPVVASQALLTTAAAAQSGVTPGDAALSKAQERSDKATEELLVAQTKQDESDAKVEAARKKSRSAEKALADEQAKKEPDKAALEQLSTDASNAREELETERRAREAARRSLAAAEDKARSAAHDLRAAQSRVSAVASGTGKLGDVSGSIASSNESLTAGVVDIVREVNQSYLRDACFGFTSDLLRDHELLKTLQGLKPTSDPDNTVDPVRMVQSLVTVCKSVLTSEGVNLLLRSGASEAKLQEILRTLQRDEDKAGSKPK